MIYFAYLFQKYDQFLSKDSGRLHQEDAVVFDRNEFLIDQPTAISQFISAFIQSQMFATFIDSYSKPSGQYYQETIAHTTIFDKYTDAVKQQLEEMDWFNENFITSVCNKMASNSEDNSYKIIQLSGPKQDSNNIYAIKAMTSSDSESDLEEQTLSKPLIKKLPLAAMRRRFSLPVQSLSSKKIPSSNYIPDKVTKSNTGAEFHEIIVDTMMKEIASKTKAVILDKLSSEDALQDYYGDVEEVKEKTLIKILYEMLERTFNHGIAEKSMSNESVLWKHLSRYRSSFIRGRRGGVVSGAISNRSVPTATNGCSYVAIVSIKRHLSENILTLPLNSYETEILGEKRDHISEIKRILRRMVEKPSLIEDLTAIAEMKEIGTDVGYVKAFLRLALEKKCLSNHLKELVERDDYFLVSQYKECALIHNQDARHQLFMHLLSFSLFNFRCMTTSYYGTELIYNILVISSCGSTSRSFWIILIGDFGCTKQIYFDEGAIYTDIRHRNLGRIRAIVIGDEVPVKRNRNKIKQIIVQNTLMAHLYGFPCHQWDLQYCLILPGVLINIATDKSRQIVLREYSIYTSKMANRDSSNLFFNPMQLLEKHRTNQVYRNEGQSKKGVSVITDNKNSDMKTIFLNILNEIEELVNNPQPLETPQINYLLYGKNGFCDILYQIFNQNQLRSSRFKGFKQEILSAWDFIEKIVYNLSKQTKKIDTEKVIVYFIQSVQRINQNMTNFDQATKFQAFIHEGISNKMLAMWLTLFPNIQITKEHFDPQSPLLNVEWMSEISDAISRLLTHNLKLDNIFDSAICCLRDSQSFPHWSAKMA
ncbi:DENN domain-containing protein 5B [Trichoplax sp. H2]|nr:DENN domain-containing protein 5B [Trichoplax sp. H2]|eukprot:RDD45208.1 DENN domain-containing protein 5B [Trichoplax sp. H2]